MPSQAEAIREYAQRRGLHLPAGYEFPEEFTGKVMDRPQLNKIRQLIRQGAVNAVIVYTVDRLARKTSVADLLLDELTEAGVALHVVSWGRPVTPNDRSQFLFEAVISDLERERIVERTTRGRRKKLHAGAFPGTGRPPYGYDKVGQRYEMRLVINERQAEIVRRIYRWYAIEHISILEIIRLLRGTPSPGDDKQRKDKKRPVGEWEETRVYGILSDSVYAGRYVYARRTATPTTLSVPAIIDEEIWQLAQARLAIGKQQSKRSTKYNYLLARRFKCHCRSALQPVPSSLPGKVHFYYRCRSLSARSAAPRCGQKPLPVRIVDAAVWQRLKELLRDPQALRTLLIDAQAALDAQNAYLRQDLARIDRAIARAEDDLRSSARTFSVAEREGKQHVAEVFRRDMEVAEQLLADLHSERLKTEAKITSTISGDNFIRRIEGLASRVRDHLDAATFEQRREVIEELDITADLRTQDDGTVKVILHLFGHEISVELQSLSPSIKATGKHTPIELIIDEIAKRLPSEG